jgi:hypothetical protein
MIATFNKSGNPGTFGQCADVRVARFERHEPLDGFDR